MPDMAQLVPRSTPQSTPPPDSSALNLLVKASEADSNGHSKWEKTNGGGGVRAIKRCCAGEVKKKNVLEAEGAKKKRLEEHVEDWVRRRIQAGVPKNQCQLPFLSTAPKLADCYHCGRVIYPGDKLECVVQGCEVVCHFDCVKNFLSAASLKEFKCPQHACYLCGKKNYLLRCTRCHIATHDKCTAFPEHVIHLLDQPGRIICWRHPEDLQSMKQTGTANSIEDLFNQLPIPSSDEEFKIDINWKDSVVATSEPPPYVYTRRNIYLIKKKREAADSDTGCTCRGLECTDGCVCRVQSISCSKACRCSDKCNNRPFRKEKKIKLVQTEFCGWGVVAAEPIVRGDFIIEYVGEVIDDASCEKRLWDLKDKGVSNFYMCEIRKDFTIDATYKGNFSRFLNHSCDPNCKLEKWQVEGEIRVGVFAARSIEVGEALTYDYRFVQFGNEVKCHCGTSNCQGYLGSKRKIDVLEIQWGVKRKRTSTAFLEVI